MFLMRKCVNVAAIKLRSLEDNSIFGCDPSSITKIAAFADVFGMDETAFGRKCI
jgi:hypothetical protein